MTHSATTASLQFRLGRLGPKPVGTIDRMEYLDSAIEFDLSPTALQPRINTDELCKS